MSRSARPLCADMTVCVLPPPTGRLVPYMWPAPASSVACDVPWRMGRSMPRRGYLTVDMIPSSGKSSWRRYEASDPEPDRPVHGSLASPSTDWPLSWRRLL